MQVKEKQAQLGNNPKNNQLIVTNGSKEGLIGIGCFFIRSSQKAVTAQSIVSEVCYGLINPSILPSLTGMVKHIIMNALKAQVLFS